MTETKKATRPPRRKPRATPHGFRLPPNLSDVIRAVAAERGVKLTTIVVAWLEDRARAEGRL